MKKKNQQGNQQMAVKWYVCVCMHQTSLYVTIISIFHNTVTAATANLKTN